METQPHIFLGQEWSPCLIRHIAGLCMGRTLKEIAADLGLTYNTVRSYNTRVGDKMGLTLRPQITAKSIANNFDTEGNYKNELVYVKVDKTKSATAAPSPEGPAAK